ncbi:MAG: tRNA 2-thiouridine(34) synthase MnmA [candidate division Zixibacteria bacterium]|nr:tRNA 2-thiouridine(34) synthase MnmA [candidate division Zixibacteria bacterium]
MSGGVDSSLAAFLLKQKGYQVVGISMKLWDFKEVGGDLSPDGRCCSAEALNDARTVCEKMKIPHYVVDLKDDFKREVISNFVEEYNKGRTPNPCIICNTEIKWRCLWEKAKALGAEYLTTGHYARIKYDDNYKRFLLLKGVDPTRDQSYALWGLSQENLAKTLFPLGELTKKEVRAKAREHELKVAEKTESQEICFVADDDYPRFIKEWLDNQGQGPALSGVEGARACPERSRGVKGQGKKIQPGPIFNLRGERIGEHKGTPFYTIGQRRGLSIALGKPLYVVRIDADKNAIYVGENNDLFKSTFIVSDLNWIAFDDLKKEIECRIKIRYQHQPQKGGISPLTKDEVKVKFEKPERAITPGQSAVFYQDDVVLGGGIIDRVVNDRSTD